MKKSLLKKSLAAILILLIVCLTAVSCGLINKGKNEGGGNVTENGGNTDGGNEDGGNESGGNTDSGNEDGGNESVSVNKTALNAEIALAVAGKGDYTDESYNAYLAKLQAAKATADNADATQEAVDIATAELKSAREALAVRPITEAEGASKEFRMISGDKKEIRLADYVNDNNLSKITYEVKASNAVVSLSEITEGKFTVTAGEVTKETALTVTISVSYDGTEKLAVKLDIKITNDVAPVVKEQSIVKDYDMYDLANKESIEIDFAENVDNAGNLALKYVVEHGSETLQLDDTKHTFTFGEYGVEAVTEVFNVKVSYVANGSEGTISYTYTLNLKDTSKYRVTNSNFENGLEGWTLNNTVGEAPFAGIDDKKIFWVQEFPMFNEGKYFSAYAEGAAEGSQGTLASSYFVVKSNYATYMLGGAGNQNVYITIENKDGDVLAIYRNTKFADLPAGVEDYNAQRELVGKSVFLANFVTYKVSLAELDVMGEEIRFVIHDYASSDWGVVFFDELNTYYESDELLPENAVLAENLLANKTALNAALENEITEQGDYTDESYNAYLAKLQAAKELVDDIAVTQQAVDTATKELTEAREALTVREVTEKKDANKSFSITTGNATEITISNYVDTNKLSKISYEVKASEGAPVTLSEIADGKFTITAGEVTEETDVTVSIVVKYDGEEALVVELNVKVTNDVAPELLKKSVTGSYDIYTLENKENILINFADNVNNKGNLALTYTVTYNEENIDLDENNAYTFTFGNYTDEVTNEVFTVTVAYEANGEAGSLEYTYTLAMKNTTAYRLTNGGFESDLEGWTVGGGKIGNVDTATNYWVNDPDNVDGYVFDMDGEKMFSAYAPDSAEGDVGTLTSSTFVVSSNRVITFKLGAAKHDVFVEIVDAETNTVYARYGNPAWNAPKDVACKLHAYKAVLPEEAAGKTVYIRIVDNATGDYGLFFCDSFVTYYEEVPTEGFIDAINIKYAVANGSFETGNLYGWIINGEIGVVTNASTWDNADHTPYGKEGDYLFTGTGSYGADTYREGHTGTLTSSVFEIGGAYYISFMLGGGGNEACYVQVIDASTNEVLARYHQQAQNDAVLIQYVADLSAYKGRTVRFQVVDYASGNWGCVSFDNLVTYYASKDDLPQNAITATDIKYQIVNGGFETGDLGGWESIGEIGVVTNANGYWSDISYGKDGTYLFTGVESYGADTMREVNTGTLTSSAFVIGGTGYISFKLGGGGNELCYIQIIDVATGDVLAKYHQQAQQDATLIQYVADLSGYIGKTVKLQIVDQATSGWGCVSFDNVVTYYAEGASLPEGAITANDIK